MIYVNLFFEFLKIGTVSFGGGYGMIALIRETALHHNWLTESAFINLIAVSESTPGPIAVNMATFIGAAKGGILGSFLATLGVALPSFAIILLIASTMKNLHDNAYVRAFLSGIRPCVAGMILATAVTMWLSSFLSLKQTGDKASCDIRGIFIFFALFALNALYRKWKKKSASPIFLLLFSAALGIVLYR